GEGGQESSLALQVRTLRIVERVAVEHIVLDAGDQTISGDEMPTAGDPFGVGRRRLIEALRGRCPPIDVHLPTAGVGEADPADVGGFVLVDEVESPEAQTFLSAVEADELIFVQSGEGIAFGPMLMVASDLGDPHGSEASCSLLPQLVESGVEFVELG